MKRTLFGYTIIMKALIGFCDPTTQEAIETKINEYGDSISSTVTYKNFKCPRDIIFKKISQEYDKQHEMEENFFQKFSQGENAEFPEAVEAPNKNLLTSQSTAFEKYSRELDEQDFENLPGSLQADSVRIVDFESIVNGFNNEELKRFAETLKSDEGKLKNALTEWIENKDIFAYFRDIPYVLNESIQKECKANMSKAIEKLLNYPSGREMLILILCIEKFENKPLKIFITDLGAYADPDSSIALNFSNNINIESQTLYHEINHWIHYRLGLQMTAKIAGDFSTPFGKDFLQLKDQEFYRNNANEIEDEILLHEDHNFLCKDKEKTCKEKILKIFDIQTTWDNLEELWNIVGFANINNVIYINHLSDMDLLNKAPWGHEASYDYDNRNEVLMKLYEEGAKRPDANSWKIWLKLHKKQEDTEYLFVHQYIDATIQAQMKLFNITSELRKIDKECLLDMLLYIYSSSSDWDCVNELAKDWQENNPELFEKIDDLKIQAKSIVKDGMFDIFDMV